MRKFLIELGRFIDFTDESIWRCVRLAWREARTPSARLAAAMSVWVRLRLEGHYREVANHVPQSEEATAHSNELLSRLGGQD